MIRAPITASEAGQDQAAGAGQPRCRQSGEVGASPLDEGGSGGGGLSHPVRVGGDRHDDHILPELDQRAGDAEAQPLQAADDGRFGHREDHRIAGADL